MKEINDYIFDSEVISGNVVVEFYSPNCQPCRRITPFLQDLSKSFSNIKFLKINVEENNESVLKASVRSIPTILFLKNGAELTRLTGYRDYETIKEIINQSYKHI